MDARMIEWLGRTAHSEISPQELLDQGASLLRAEPSLPAVVEADCHCRLAALAFLCGDAAGAVRHGRHAIGVSMDSSAEARLHVLSRAVAIIELVLAAQPDALTGATTHVEQGRRALADAVDTTLSAANDGVLHLAVLEGLAATLSTLAPTSMDGAAADHARTQIGRDAVRAALALEAAGEQALAQRAHALSASHR
ncbi:MAG: hypothetical protein GY713_00635 [Actinomycetia bacterium]|nr:hypothetical protein [Actinomycetes bacterium]MCP3909441.1 hypothetical protein [Actinomycetes bacterium]